MEEIKKLTARFAVEFAEEKDLLKKDPMLALVIMGVFADGFEYAYCFEGSKDDCKIGEKALNYVKENFEGLEKEAPSLFLLFMLSYATGANKGFKERDGITIEKDENGNIIGLTH